MITYGDIISVTKDTQVPLNFSGEANYAGLHMTRHHHPISITEQEFKILNKIIVENNLKSGYEVATAFGVSALAAGLGFKETGGQLVSMDAYIEEQYNNCGAYIGRRGVYPNSDGFKSANFLANTFKVIDNVSFEVGWSPDDTRLVLEKQFNPIRLDYVFIDALHTQEAIVNDLLSIKDLLMDKFIGLLHDAISSNSSVKDISKILGVNFTSFNTVYSMGGFLKGVTYNV